MIRRILVLTAAVVLGVGGWLSASAHATSGWGCFTIQHVSTDDVLMLRKGPSSKFAAVGSLHPRQHGVLAEKGACKPADAPPSKQWCPLTHYSGDKVETGWARLRFLALSECP